MHCIVQVGDDVVLSPSSGISFSALVIMLLWSLSSFRIHHPKVLRRIMVR